MEAHPSARRHVGRGRCLTPSESGHPPLLSEELAALRQGLLSDREQPFSKTAFFGALEVSLRAKTRDRLHRVVNATGIVIHTNLGRAPLAVEAVKAGLG